MEGFAQRAGVVRFAGTSLAVMSPLFVGIVRLESCPQAHQRSALIAKPFREAGHEASQVGRSGAAADKRICVQGAQAVFRQAILRVKTRRMRPRHLRSPG